MEEVKDELETLNNKTIEQQVDEYLVKEWPEFATKKDEEAPPVEKVATKEVAKEPPEKGESDKGEVEEVAEEEEAKEEVEFDEEKEALRQQIEMLSEEKSRGQVAPQAEVVKPVVSEAVKEQVVNAMQFVNQDTLQTLLSDPAAFNTFVNKVIDIAKQGALSAIPAVIKRQEDERNELIEAVQTFYTKNKDLVKYHQNVSLATQQVKALNPSFTIKQVLEKAEQVVRERLKITRAVETIEGKRKAGDVKPGLKGGPQKAVNKAGEEAGTEVYNELMMFKKM